MLCSLYTSLQVATKGPDVSITDSAADATSTASPEIAVPAFRPRSRPVLRRQRISDWVYDELCEAIRSLSLPPGTPVSEPTLAAQLGVSRAPVREALTRLADQRLVTVIPQVGTRVAPIMMNDVAEACFVRAALEVSAFQTATASDSTNTGELRRILDAGTLASAHRDTEAFLATDDELHQEIFRLAGFPHVWDMIRGVKLNLDRLRRLHLPDVFGNPDIVDEHRKIVEALERGDDAHGAAIIRRHATRIFADSDAVRRRHPEYFEE